MFKPLLRTLPSLSGNFTISCKLKEFNSEDTNEYSTYVRLANLIPLQNFLANRNIEINLLNGKYEYDIIKYFYHYSNYFYKENFNYNKQNYGILNLDSLYNNVNDTRNKDYEFGCKRIQYSQTGSQFNFYAPIYIDNVKDLPEYFCIYLEFNNHLTKKIKIYINKDDKRNYLKNYLTRYLKYVDEQVIFCLPDSLQATYFGIDVKNGGIVQYKDNAIGNIYTNQMTINNFDYTICQGFERNNLIMKQVIPLSFSFNINDILNKYEQSEFYGAKVKIYGFYYSKNDLSYNLFDFDINYTNVYQKYYKYNENTGKYQYSIGMNNEDKINIMNVGFPSLNESKYIKYAFTNKITPKYCKFKMNLSHDDDPYITNINFAYSYIQYPNNKYGYFPTMFKGIFVNGIIIDNDLKLPIGNDLKTYYNTDKYIANKIYINSYNGDKHIKLMSNYCSSWFNINEYSPDFNDNNFLNDIFNNENNWEDVKFNYSYFNGILYDLNNIKKYNLDKFGVFLGVNMHIYSQEELRNSIVTGKYILSFSDVSSINLFQYDNSLNMLHVDDNTEISYYNKIFNVLNNNVVYNDSVKTNYIFTNKAMIKDKFGKYIEEENYINENSFYKFDDIMKIFSSLLDNDIIEELKGFEIIGYYLLDGINNINYFEDYDKYNSKSSVKSKRFILDNILYKNDNRFKWLYDNLYYSTASNNIKIQLKNNYDNLNYNTDVNDKFCMFIKTSFIHKSDIFELFINHNLQYLLAYLNEFETYIYEHVGNLNGIDINNYFIIKENENKDIFVDTYNLCKYIDSYNNIHNEKISKEFTKTKEIYFKVLNKDHILEYYYNLNKDEYYNSTFNTINKDIYKNKLSDSSDNYKQKIIYSNSNILDCLYVKERCWLIDNNENINKKMKAVDRYISLYNYLKKYDEELIIYIHTFYDDKSILNWILDNISDTRSSNNNFIFNFKDNSLSLNLCFKKNMVLLDKSLINLIKDKYFLYLYITYKECNENNNTWKLLSYNDMYENKLPEYDYREIDDYLLPLYNDPYINSNDSNIIFNMLEYGKINKYGKYILNSGKYFKEINVFKEIYNILCNDKQFVYNWQYTLSKLKDDKNNLIYNNEYINELVEKWNEYCLINSINIESIDKYNEYIASYDDNDEMYNYYVNLKNKEYGLYVENILNFLKEYDNGNVYYDIIKDKGIILYSFVNKDNIKFDNIEVNNENLIYDDQSRIYIYNDVNTNKKYGFYWLSLDIDNTNNSFYIKDEYNLNLIFNSINNVDLHSPKFKKYFNKIFYILYPMLKINIFNEYSKLNKSIIYPYEIEININYIQSLLNQNDYSKYSMLQETESDLLYNNIVSILDNKKIKLLRYFNYISPYLKSTNIIEDCWNLKFINNDNKYKSINKYNIFNKENINIYHYNGIHLYDGIYDTEYHKYNIHSLIYQYEYKHFEDNLLFNLPEEIIIKDKKNYTEEEISKYKDNKIEIKNKKIEILLKYFYQKGFDYKNIILFLFNKYNSNMIIEKAITKNSISEKIYNITYKFNLI